MSQPAVVIPPASTSGSEPAAASTATAAPPAGATGAAVGSGSEGATGATAAAPPDAETAYGRQVRMRERQLVERQQRFASERAEVDARAKSIAEKEAAIAEKERLLESDPLAYAVRHKGYRDEDLARRFLGNGQPSPQELEAKRQAEYDARIKTLQDRLDAIDGEKKKQSEEAERARQTQSQQESNQRAVTAFKSHAASEASKFPLASAALAHADPDVSGEALAALDAMATRLVQGGAKERGPALWSQMLQRYNSHLEKMGAKVTSGASNGSTQGSEKQGQQGTSAADSEPAPTLSGKTAAARSSVPNTDDFLALELKDPGAAKEALIAKIREAKAAKKKPAGK